MRAFAAAGFLPLSGSYLEHQHAVSSELCALMQAVHTQQQSPILHSRVDVVEAVCELPLALTR